MVRITPVARAADRAELRIEGWLSDEDATLLQREVDAVLTESERVVLDLHGVRRIDPSALPGLRALTESGRATCTAPEFLSELLNAHGIAVSGSEV